MGVLETFWVCVGFGHPVQEYLIAEAYKNATSLTSLSIFELF